MHEARCDCLPVVLPGVYGWFVFFFTAELLYAGTCTFLLPNPYYTTRKYR